MSSTTTQRAVSLILAIVFLISTIGLVGLVVVQANQQDKQQQALQEALTKSNSGEPLNCNSKADLAYTPEVPMQGKPLPNFTPVSSIATLSCDDIVVGTGTEVKAGDTVTAHYTGAVAATGIVFQSSLDSGNPIPFSLNGVIQGWTQGVPGMKEGGKRRLYIPASLAYGATPPQGSGIPANADLVFDVEIVKIGQ